MLLYFISGLGADQQAFQKIKWPAHVKPIYLPWLEPLKNESLNTYALRMIAEHSLQEPFILCGLSFGGIICQEIHKQYPATKIIIISSLHKSNQLSPFLRVAGFLHLHKLNLIYLLSHLPWLTNWAFGAHQSKLKSYLQQQIKKTTDNYLSWSLNAILHWKQKEKIPVLKHIHGNNDKLFPPKYIQPDYLLKHGSHFMILTHADKISDILEKELA
ncbi:MAG: alpha/beta hydrolase [Chitinophagaceae bacterium]|nr:alpha/beta hydrolase [Chitinophagaceae bacterium]